jgi:SAM-dependent methyltransferase
VSPPAAVWTDREGRIRTVAEPLADFYRPIGDFQGAAYARNAFALGTAQEVGFLVPALGIGVGTCVVDVGCGTGRHLRALAEHGADVIGIDLSHRLLTVAQDALPGAWAQGDARRLPLPSGCADVVLSLCQGGFGIAPSGDQAVLDELARILRPGGRLALTAFSAWFAARFLAPDDAVDAGRSLLHSRGEVRGQDDERRSYDLWTTCYTAPHLALLVECCGLKLESISGIEPGKYGVTAPTLAHPELLVRARKEER